MKKSKNEQTAELTPKKRKKRRSKKIKTTIAIIFLIAGCAVLFYPSIGNVITYFQQMNVVADYEKQVQAMRESEIRRQKELAIKYNENIGQITFKDPFEPASEPTDPPKTEDEELDEYYTALSINDEHMMGYIKIPQIHVTCPIYHGATELQLQKGVGHLQGTALPIGGVGTHCVLTGHTGVPGNMLFTDLDKLKIGDKFYLHVLDEVLAYRIDEINVVLPSDASKLKTEPGLDLCTLVTCTPYGINTHRLLVRGVRTEYIDGEDDYESGSILTTDAYGNIIEKPLDGRDDTVYVFGIPIQKWVLWILIPVAALILILLAVAIIRLILRKRREKEEKGEENDGKGFEEHGDERAGEEKEE